MTPEQFQKVESIFNRAVGATEEARERLLAECEPDVASEVREMLAVHPHAGDFLDVPAPDLEVLAPEFVGRQIGPYEIKEKIGVGGSGTVFRAERVDDFRQRVAIKIIRSGLTTEEIVRRFKIERRVLANLQHENIARLIDAGVTSEGLPYLVMEFVDGEPIDAYCRRAHLSIEDRLRLFCDVCAGVHAAHRNLVVHRDLKPSNILITSEGVVKLVDFGIAKILDPEAEHTVTEQRMLTPRYASPEQITGRAVTTASDIYSLGVILYELLSGESPYQMDSRSVAEIERRMKEVQPLRPSAAVSRSRTTSRRVVRRIAGDLDNIVLMAMRHEPERRYVTAIHLAQDVRRHLDGMPITARPDTFRYRASKFVARHRASVAVSGVSLVALIAGLVVISVLLLETSRARRDADQRANEASLARNEASQRADEASLARIEADQRAAEATAVNQMMSSMLESISPFVAEGRDVSMLVDIIDETAHQIDDELAEYPDARAAMHLKVGSAYGALNRIDDARHHLDLALREFRPRGDSLELAAALEQRGTVAYLEGEHEQAIELQREAVRIADRVEPRGRRACIARVALATTLGAFHQTDDALDLYHEVVIMTTGGEHPDVRFNAEVALAAIMGEQGRVAEAIALYDRLLTDVNDNDPNVIIGRSNYASLLSQALRLQDSGEQYEIVNDAALQTLGPEHSLTRKIQANYSRHFERIGELDRALELLQPAYENTRKVAGIGHPDTLFMMNNLAGLYMRLDRLDEAEVIYLEALEENRRLGPSPALAANLSGLGSLYRKRDDEASWKLAEKTLLECIDVTNQVTPEGHPWRRHMYTNLSKVYAPDKLDDPEAYERCLERAR